MAKTMEEIRNRITYTKVGDYYVPNIALSDPEDAPPIRKYGKMRREYLKEHCPIQYESMVMDEELFPHLREVDEAASHRKEELLPKLAKEAGVTEELKKKDMLEWVRRMEACSQQVEEIILQELIYS